MGETQVTGVPRLRRTSRAVSEYATEAVSSEWAREAVTGVRRPRRSSRARRADGVSEACSAASTSPQYRGRGGTILASQIVFTTLRPTPSPKVSVLHVGFTQAG